MLTEICNALKKRHHDKQRARDSYNVDIGCSTVDPRVKVSNNAFEAAPVREGSHLALAHEYLTEPW